MKIGNRIKKSPAEHVFDVFNILVLCLFTFICLYPFYFVFIYSISDAREAAKGLYLLPSGLTFANYLNIFQLPGLVRATFISVARTAVGSGLTVLCCAFLGFLLTKEKLPGRKIIYRFAVATMYMSAGLIPWFLTLRLYGITNTFWLYIIPSAISMFYVVLMKTFFEQLPASIEESAKIDGAGLLTVFIKIILPLSMPIVATILVFSAVEQWNSYFDNFIMVTDSRLNTLQLILFNYLRRAEVIAADINQLRVRAQTVTPMTVRMTVTMVVTMPILFVYPIAQRYFVKGIMIGAIKG